MNTRRKTDKFLETVLFTDTHPQPDEPLSLLSKKPTIGTRTGQASHHAFIRSRAEKENRMS